MFTFALAPDRHLRLGTISYCVEYRVVFIRRSDISGEAWTWVIGSHVTGAAEILGAWKGETVADACCELRLRGVDRIGHVVGLMEAPVSKALAATFPSARSWLSAAAFGDVSGSSAVGQSSEGLPSARLRRQVLAASVVVDELERVFCRALEQGGLEDEQQVMALLKGELLRIERRAALRSGRRRASLSPRAVVAPAAH